MSGVKEKGCDKRSLWKGVGVEEGGGRCTFTHKYNWIISENNLSALRCHIQYVQLKINVCIHIVCKCICICIHTNVYYHTELPLIYTTLFKLSIS